MQTFSPRCTMAPAGKSTCQCAGQCPWHLNDTDCESGGPQAGRDKILHTSTMHTTAPASAPMLSPMDGHHDSATKHRRWPLHAAATRASRHSVRSARRHHLEPTPTWPHWSTSEQACWGTFPCPHRVHPDLVHPRMDLFPSLRRGDVHAQRRHLPEVAY